LSFNIFLEHGKEILYMKPHHEKFIKTYHFIFFTFEDSTRQW